MRFYSHLVHLEKHLLFPRIEINEATMSSQLDTPKPEFINSIPESLA